MGEVYLAEDPQIDRRLAIKTVRLVGRPQEIEDRKRRLLREARAAGRLLHPNVVTLFDAGEAEGLLYLAFEFVEGTDLAVRLDPEQQRLSLRQVLRIVRQAADALDYAHGQGIVHRDIKPSNILLDLAGRAKVADFGIAKMAGQSTELTMAGSVIGSPQYLSPEQIRGDDLDGRSDIFSLGVVLYEMLSGRRPFEGDTITTLVYQILHKDPPPVSELRAVPPRVETLLRGMLAKSRDERIPTAGEVARELAAIEAELSDETLSAPAGPGPFEPTRVLPRRTTDAPILPVGAPSGTRSGLGTVPASPETTPSVPPPAPMAAAPIPTASTPAVPAAVASMPPPPPPARKMPVAVLVAGVLLLVAVGGIAGGGYYVWKLWQARNGAAEPATQTAETSQTAPPAVSPTSAPASVPVSPAPVQQQVPETKTPAQASPATSQTPPAVHPKPAEKAPAPPVVPAHPEPRVPGPAASEPAAPAPAPAPAPREPEPEAAPETPAADQTIRTGLQVGFRIIPPDAYVLVEGKVIGQAQDWSGLKGARPYAFPGPGTYMVKIKKDGMRETLIAVEAGAGGASTISARLRPRAAADIEASDLEIVRVREGISLNVRPGNAEVLVDGQSAGEARRYAGGLLRPREILVLSPGKHRLSFVAPGYARKDILVEVTETADKQRQRINVDLTAGGNGG